MKSGKAEAQYFPPTGGHDKAGCVTRMGFKAGVTKEDVEKAMKEFGQSDKIYDLMKPYKVFENETWMVSGLSLMTIFLGKFRFDLVLCTHLGQKS